MAKVGHPKQSRRRVIGAFRRGLTALERTEAYGGGNGPYALQAAIAD